MANPQSKKYVVVETSFINNAIRQPGDVVEYVGEVHDNLVPFKSEAQAEAIAQEAEAAENPPAPEAPLA
jgi:hypothetical protein